MYKKILFGTCLTEYCEHIFNFALNMVLSPALIPGLAVG